ncbi:hypothetical protein A9R05_45465 (plasmid) [Burkholderia sp. KK1]|nr:hypothetical protein A9R05_45465 [Burkholderia sp. KK1]
MKIRAARGNDLDVIKTLLTGSGLTASDVDPKLLDDSWSRKTKAEKLLDALALSDSVAPSFYGR